MWSKEKEEPDAWLAGLDEATVEKAIGEAAAARQRREASEALIPEVISVDKFALKQELISLLVPGETVPAALRRLGGGGAKPTTKKQKQQRQQQQQQQAAAGKGKGNGKAAAAAAAAGQAEEQKKAFDRVTDIANTLLSVGEYDIYSADYDDLVAEMAQRKRTRGDVVQSVSALSYNKEGGEEDDENDQEENGNGASKYLWEYMGHDGQTHGPFTTQQILEWRSQGFFTGESAVHMRLIRGAEPEEGEEQETEAAATGNQRGAGGGGEAHSPRKRVRFSEPPAAAKAGNTTQDLLDDLDDDENGDVAAASHASGKPSLAERQSYTQWHSSDAIAFERYR